ncbi:MAG: glycosyltransferase [Bacteroidales bacterium]|jgi:glycosyltransferase involved in cell wall biosynthesis|nr:glycosyltransferase [Bacteroidales bacterium]
MMNIARPSVFLFSAWYPTEFEPLLGNFVQNHAKAISKQTQVTVIHPYEDISYKQKQYFVFQEETNGNLVEIRIRYKGIKINNFFGKLLRFIRTRSAYRKGIAFAIKKHGLPDIVHVNILTRTVFPAFGLKRKYKIPYIITEHWSRYLPEANIYKGFLRKKLTQYAVRNAIAVTAVSSQLKKAMLNHRLYNSNYYIVPNVINEALFCPAHIEKQKKSILHVSGLNDMEKNISGILRTIQRLSTIRNDFELLIIGNKHGQTFAKDMAKQLQILDRYVFIKDEMPNEQLPYYFNYSDFHLLFSNYETQGLVLIESFACGKPVIATRTGGILDVVNESNGILVTPKDEDELLYAIIYMLDNHQNYSTNTLREYAVGNYGETVIGNSFLSIYQESLSNNTKNYV